MADPQNPSSVRSSRAGAPTGCTQSLTWAFATFVGLRRCRFPDVGGLRGHGLQVIGGQHHLQGRLVGLVVDLDSDLSQIEQPIE
jgi:hypothetical protein